MSSINAIISLTAITPIGNAGLLLPSRMPQNEPTQKCNIKYSYDYNIYSVHLSALCVRTYLRYVHTPVRGKVMLQNNSDSVIRGSNAA
jgi:hypothetical protein